MLRINHSSHTNRGGIFAQNRPSDRNTEYTGLGRQQSTEYLCWQIRCKRRETISRFGDPVRKNTRSTRTSDSSSAFMMVFFTYSTNDGFEMIPSRSASEKELKHRRKHPPSFSMARMLSAVDGFNSETTALSVFIFEQTGRAS